MSRSKAAAPSSPMHPGSQRELQRRCSGQRIATTPMRELWSSSSALETLWSPSTKTSGSRVGTTTMSTRGTSSLSPRAFSLSAESSRAVRTSPFVYVRSLVRLIRSSGGDLPEVRSLSSEDRMIAAALPPRPWVAEVAPDSVVVRADGTPHTIELSWWLWRSRPPASRRSRGTSVWSSSTLNATCRPRFLLGVHR